MVNGQTKPEDGKREAKMMTVDGERAERRGGVERCYIFARFSVCECISSRRIKSSRGRGRDDEDEQRAVNRERGVRREFGAENVRE